MAGSVFVKPIGMRALQDEMGPRFAMIGAEEFKQKWDNSKFH
jgi:hypothetical protein